MIPDPTSEQQRARLMRGVRGLVDDGRPPPCLVDPAPFTSDERADRSEAAAACSACPMLEACRAYAWAAREPAHVWGGVDLTPCQGSPRGLEQLAAVLSSRSGDLAAVRSA